MCRLIDSARGLISRELKLVNGTVTKRAASGVSRHWQKRPQRHNQPIKLSKVRCNIAEKGCKRIDSFLK
jgi:hypothetical protein